MNEQSEEEKMKEQSPWTCGMVGLIGLRPAVDPSRRSLVVSRPRVDSRNGSALAVRTARQYLAVVDAGVE